MIAIGWFVDVKWARFGDFGFWLHLFGAVTFWGALSLGSGDEFGKALYCAINVALVAFAIFVDRRIYAVLGAFGIAGYLGHLAFGPVRQRSGLHLRAVGDRPWHYLRRHLAASAHGRDQRLVNAAMPPALRALRPARARA